MTLVVSMLVRESNVSTRGERVDDRVGAVYNPCLPSNGLTGRLQPSL